MRQWHGNCEPAGKVVHTDHVIFVKGTSWFETLSEVCFGKVNIITIGKDPWTGVGQKATKICFSIELQSQSSCKKGTAMKKCTHLVVCDVMKVI